MSFLRTILENPDNQKVLAYCQIPVDSEPYFARGERAGSAFDSGSKTLFWQWGGDLPDDGKVTIATWNMLARPETGLIVCLQTGRFTFAIRVPGKETNIRHRRMQTLDGNTDITSLGTEWALLNYYMDEEDLVLEEAWEYFDE